MSFREQFKNAKGQLKETTRRVFGHGSSPASSTRSSHTTQIASPSINSLLDSPTDSGRISVQRSGSAPSAHSVAKSPGRSGDVPAKSTSLLPDQLASSNINPALESGVSLTKPDLVARPEPTLPGVGEIGIGSTWPCLNGFLQVLSKCPDVLGGLKPVIDGFSACIEMYEVSPFQSA